MNIDLEHFKKIFLEDTPLIDVRAPVEFLQGSLPGAVNLPILNDEERALIGTIYKQQGQEAAILHGHELVSGKIKEERLEKWRAFILAHPRTVLYCFRGGKRSHITQQWLNEAGIERPLIIGGYKRVRQYLMEGIEQFSQGQELLVLSGPTGSGKTQLIKAVQSSYPTIDLEGLAKHRGSAFGSTDTPQPSQIDFENQLAVQLMKLESAVQKGHKILVEDESRLIGRAHLPTVFFECLRRSQVIWLEEPLEVRVENIFKDYIIDSAVGLAVTSAFKCEEEANILRSEALRVFAKYKKSLLAIQRKLGGLRTQEVMVDLEKAEADFLSKNEIKSNQVWIEKLLKYYYDPLYLGSLERRQVNVFFKGSSLEAQAYLKNLKS